MHYRKTFTIESVKAVEGEDRSLIVRISSIAQDRSKDVVIPSGVDLTNYLKNPVVAAFHRYDRPAIGSASDIVTDDTGITAKVTFLPKGINPEADMLYEIYKLGVQKGWSIGFTATEYAKNDQGGYVFSKWELLEFSAVLVPDNPEALTEAKTKGIDVSPIEQVLKSEIVKGVEIDSQTKSITISMADGVKTVHTADDELLAYFKEIFSKEGRVISEKNRKLITSCIAAMEESMQGLNALLLATEPKSAEEKKEVDIMSQLDKVRQHSVRLDQEVGKFLKSIK